MNNHPKNCYYCDEKAVAYDPFDKLELCRKHADEVLDDLKEEYDVFKREYAHSTEII